MYTFPKRQRNKANTDRSPQRNTKYITIIIVIIINSSMFKMVPGWASTAVDIKLGRIYSATFKPKGQSHYRVQSVHCPGTKSAVTDKQKATRFWLLVEILLHKLQYIKDLQSWKVKGQGHAVFELTAQERKTYKVQILFVDSKQLEQLAMLFQDQEVRGRVQKVNKSLFICMCCWNL